MAQKLEGKTLGDASGVKKLSGDIKKHDKNRSSDAPAHLTAPRSDPPDQDVTTKETTEKKDKKEKRSRDEDGDKSAKKAKKSKKDSSSD